MKLSLIAAWKLRNCHVFSSLDKQGKKTAGAAESSTRPVQTFQRIYKERPNRLKGHTELSKTPHLTSLRTHFS